MVFYMDSASAFLTAASADVHKSEYSHESEVILYSMPLVDSTLGSLNEGNRNSIDGLGAKECVTTAGTMSISKSEQD